MDEPLQPELPLDDDASLDALDFETIEERRNRHACSRRIAENPQNFKFCEGCGNLFKRGGNSDVTGVCIACHGYRFNYDPAEVREQALRICSGPRRSVLPADYH